jgi:hypothetical protein
MSFVWKTDLQDPSSAIGFYVNEAALNPTVITHPCDSQLLIQAVVGHRDGE